MSRSYSRNGRIDRSGSSNRSKIMIGVGCAVALIIILALSAWALSGNKGTIVETPQRAIKHGPTSRTLDSKYIKLVYPGSYQLQDLHATGDDYESYMLDGGTNYEKHLTITVSKLPDGSLNNNSAYLLRKSLTDSYTARNVTVAGNTVTVWIKTDGTEQTVLIPHGEMVASLSFVSMSSFDSLETEVDTLLASFQWKV